MSIIKRFKEAFRKELNNSLLDSDIEQSLSNEIKAFTDKLEKRGITRDTIVRCFMKIFEVNKQHAVNLYCKFTAHCIVSDATESEFNVIRAKELINAMIVHFYTDFVSGEQTVSTSEIVNSLFLIGFTEEELINEFGYTEDEIDKANEEVGE